MKPPLELPPVSKMELLERAATFASSIVPEVRTVRPVYVFVPLSESVPAASLVKEPLPDMLPENAIESERLNMSEPLLLMFPTMEPVVLLDPI